MNEILEYEGDGQLIVVEFPVTQVLSDTVQHTISYRDQHGFREIVFGSASELIRFSNWLSNPC